MRRNPITNGVIFAENTRDVPVKMIIVKMVLR